MFIHVMGRHLHELPVHCRKQVWSEVSNITIANKVKAYEKLIEKKYNTTIDTEAMFERSIEEFNKVGVNYRNCARIADGPYLMAPGSVVGELIEAIRKWISLSPANTIPLAVRLTTQCMELSKTITALFTETK
ncbi:hypothetical protein [Geomonas agri]|uniref:hypothetical protein n=1 Tax=Geomonas agri TaxID=2873702 RepID=UPI001CD3162A|nr:hypothetical protein [Geomonas agri]